jgi:hypothetical protein
MLNRVRQRCKPYKGNTNHKVGIRRDRANAAAKHIASLSVERCSRAIAQITTHDVGGFSCSTNVTAQSN